MIRRLLAKHPEYDVLSRHADGELPPSEAMEINGHLAECEECRDEVDFMVELRARLRGLDNPPLPRTMLPEILSLRAQGERKILDQGEPPEVRERSRVSKGAVTSGIAVGLTALGLALFAPGETEAGASSLVFEPRTDGTSTPFVFETSGVHADAASLRARGEFLTHLNGPWDPGVPSIVEVELERAEVGRFEGRRTLPAGITYARFVVETPAGEVIDGQRFWEHLERTPEGLPTFDALLTKLNVEVADGNVPAALETSERLVERYPSRPEAWSWRHFVERQAFGELPEEALRQHRYRLAAFLRDLPPGAPAEEVAALAWYAIQVEDQGALGPLGNRLLRVAPTHRVAGALRLKAAFEKTRGDPLPMLQVLEEEWDRYGLTSSDVPLMGLQIAVDHLGDLEAAVRWADRWVAAELSQEAEAALWLSEVDTPSAEVVARLREALSWIDEGGLRRRVGEPLSLHREKVELERRKLERALGEQLLALGDTEAAVRVLARGAESGWSPALFERLADLALREGNRAGARRYVALLAADPMRVLDGDVAAAERLATLVPEAEERAALLARARAEVERRLFARDEFHRWRGPVELATAGGVARRLASELGERATIVHFWSPLYESTIETPVETAAGCERWAGLGVRVIAIATDRPVSASTGPPPISGACDEVWFLDAAGAARSALRVLTIGETLVLGEDGAVLVRTSRPDRARRAAVFLATDSGD